MTVSDLIRELQAMQQHLPVKVLLEHVDTADELGDHRIELNDRHALPADTVRRAGGSVLIKGRA